MAKLTIITSLYPKEMSKVYALSEGQLIKRSTSANLSSGTYEARDIASTSDMATLLQGLNTNQVLTFGVPRYDEGILTTKDKIKDSSPPSLIARSNDYITFSPGPAWLFLDYDPKGASRYNAMQLVELLRSTFPGIFRAGAVAYPSASSHICRTDTGEDLTGERGVHIYIPVSHGIDIPRTSQAIQDKLWEAGLGFIEISKSGSLLERTPFDPSVAQDAKLDFAAGAICGPGLEQRRGEPILIPATSKDETLDTARWIKSPRNIGALNEIKLEAKRALSAEALRRKETYALERARKEASFEANTDKPPQELVDAAYRRILAAADGAPLDPTFILYMEQGKDIVPVSVRDIMDNPGQFNGKLCLDPLEPDYENNKVVGKIYVTQDGGYINSFAHGGRKVHFTGSKTVVLMDQGYYMGVARAFTSSLLGAESGYGLLYFQETFYQYFNDAYHAKSRDTMNQLIWRRLDTMRVPDKNGDLVPVRTDVKYAANVAAALQTVAGVETQSAVPVPQPFWLDKIKMDTSGNDMVILDHSRTDAKDYVILQNGLFNLRTRQLQPFTAKYFCTSKLPFAYDPEATCPIFKSYIYETFEGDEEAVQEVMKTLAYLISPMKHLEKIFGMFGAPRSGKGVFQTVLRGLVGMENIFSTSLRKLSTDNFDLMGAIDKKVMLFADAKEDTGKSACNGSIAEILLKISGQDQDSIRRLYKGHYEGVHTARIVMFANEPPRLPESSSALANRFIVFPFDNCKLGMEDKQLKNKILTELPGIFNWCLDFLAEFYADPDLDIHTPAIGRKMESCLRDVASPIPRFLEDFCVLGEDKCVEKQTLYEAYVEMCAADRSHPASQPIFMRGIKAQASSMRHRLDTDVRVRQKGQPVRHLVRGIALQQFEDCEEIPLPGGHVFQIHSRQGDSVIAGKTVIK